MKLRGVDCYIFRENGRDVLNKQNPGSVKSTLKYLATLC